MDVSNKTFFKKKQSAGHIFRTWFAGCQSRSFFEANSPLGHHQFLFYLFFILFTLRLQSVFHFKGEKQPFNLLLCCKQLYIFLQLRPWEWHSEIILSRFFSYEKKIQKVPLRSNTIFRQHLLQQPLGEERTLGFQVF